MSRAVLRIRTTTVTRTTVEKVTVETAFRFSFRVCRSDDGAPGIVREAFRAAFRYRDPSGKIVRDAATLARIRVLAIPPAWERVWVCPKPGGHVQATGWDARGRKQYRYHPAFRDRKDGEKFGRLLAFGLALPRLRKRVASDLARPGLPRDKALAAVVRLLDRTHLRVGNREYVKANGSFGLSTLLDRHVTFPGGAVRVRFRGKSGVRHDRTVTDRELAGVVRRCRDVPGQHLFQYRDAGGRGRPVTSGDVNGYIRRTTGGAFTAKDFRTWAGTVSAAARLVAEPVPTSATAAGRVVAAVVRTVARELGNTPAVCRKSYIHPAVPEAFAAGILPRGVRRRWTTADEDRVVRLLRG